jgi:Cu/Zn superoxide dismutase
MELNDSGASGRVMMHLRGNELTVRIKARGLLPGHVHAQHIHGEGNSECPTRKAAGDDGVLSADGLPFYGPIATSLTTSGDTSPRPGSTSR